MISDVQLAFCKENFYYLNYLYRTKENYVQGVNLDTLPLHIFFDDANMQKLFSLYHSFENERIVLIEEQERMSGFSIFCCFLTYFTCFSTGHCVYYVTESKMIINTVYRVIEFVKTFKFITSLDAKYIDIRKTIEFSNGAKVILFSDITYDFRNNDNIGEMLIFDNASMKNFDKLCNTVQDIISNKTAKKAILNFNYVPPLFSASENYEIFTKEFKKYLTITHINK